MSKKRISVGDVVQVPARNVFGYVQVVALGREGVSLVRALPGVFEKPCSDIQALASQREIFCCWIFASRDLKGGFVEVVGNCPVPERDYGYPPDFMNREAVIESIENGGLYD